MAEKKRKPRKKCPLVPFRAGPFGDGGIELVLSGEPLPQSRPRVTSKGVFSSASPELRAWRASIEAAARSLSPRIILPPTKLVVVLVLGMPSSDQSRWGEISAVRPDVDNLGKSVLDALQDSDKVRKAARDLEALGGPPYVQDLPLPDDGAIGAMVTVKVHCPPPGFMRVRVEPVAWGRHTLAWTMRRLAWHCGDPALLEWPIVD